MRVITIGVGGGRGRRRRRILGAASSSSGLIPGEHLVVVTELELEMRLLRADSHVGGRVQLQAKT